MDRRVVSQVGRETMSKRETRWVVSGRDGAAVRLGLKRTTLLSKMARLGIARQAR
jgi:hypothetical protein